MSQAPDLFAEQEPAPSRDKRPASEITADLRLRLRARYSDSRRHAVLEEVANGTGSFAGRSCDLLAFNLWPSDGLEWQGHEIKASRSDWLRELKDPDKADAFAIYCDRWWIVAGDRSMVQVGELREGWGLLVPAGEGLRVVVGAAKREPKDVPRRLIAAILRRAQAASPGEHERTALREQMRRMVQEAERSKVRTERELTSVQGDLERLQKSVDAFEAASGLKISAYGGGHLGEQVARLQAIEYSSHQLVEFRRMASTAEHLAKVAKEAAEAAAAFVPGGQG